MDPTKGLFRRRPSTASTHSRLRAQSTNANTSSSPSMLSVASAAGGSVVGGAAQSCPTSPKHSPHPRRSMGTERIPEDEVAYLHPSSSPNPSTSSEAAEYAAAIEDARREQQQRHQQHQQFQRSPSRQSIKAGGRGSSMGGVCLSVSGSNPLMRCNKGNKGNNVKVCLLPQRMRRFYCVYYV